MKVYLVSYNNENRGYITYEAFPTLEKAEAYLDSEYQKDKASGFFGFNERPPIFIDGSKVYTDYLGGEYTIEELEVRE